MHTWIRRLWHWWYRTRPRHLEYGALGEREARRYLCRQGGVFLTANFRTKRGEIDLIFRLDEALVFVEVKTRSSEFWQRPAAAVKPKQRRRINRAALDYLRILGHPKVAIRFDIVEVILDDGRVETIRHVPNAFPLAHPRRYG